MAPSMQPNTSRPSLSPHTLRPLEGPSSPTMAFTPSSMREERSMSSRRDPREEQSARERQRQQDIDSAMSMTRARSNSIANSPEDHIPPMHKRHSHNHSHYPNIPAIEESPFPMLSESEEADLERARNITFGRDDEDGESVYNTDRGGMRMGGGRQSRDGSDDEENLVDDGMMMSRSMGGRRLSIHEEDMMGRSPGGGGVGLHRSPEAAFAAHERHRSVHDAGMSISLGEAAGMESARAVHGVSPRMRPQQLAMAMMGGMGPTRNHFNFGPMEEFATKEKDVLGLASPGLPGLGARSNVFGQDFGGGGGGPGRPAVRIQAPRETKEAPGSEYSSRRESTKLENGDADALDGTSPEIDGRMIGGTEIGDNESALATSPPKSHHQGLEDMENNFVRRRHRKLSNSNAISRRQGRLALFEGAGAPLPSDMPPREATFTVDMGPDRVGHAGHHSTLPTKAPRSAKNPMMGGGGGGGGAGAGYTDYPDPSTAANRDRPYRFSFYSNALPATIHARSLAELPADGQSFEDLFAGRGGTDSSDAAESEAGSNAPPRTASGSSTPINVEGQPLNGNISNPKLSMLAKAAAAAGARPGSGTPPPPKQDSLEDSESKTWWLDVLSPTDEEMRMLARVFGIHPLTTEDILLEETREKIELFRHYYLVCFRSFDQDPYSQTYLEPLNMYIIVFREGTLSFHFRGTPHPQNVRRRIKSLKDYISVTSDWISYALIDDITDAFGPLIQNIEYEVDGIDELVLILKDTEQSDMLRRIGTCRKKVMGLLRLMGNKADVVKGLAKRCNENWSVAPKSDIGLYLSDIQDHLITMTQNLNHYEKILSRSHSNYLAQISIEMTDANNQINDVLSKLTALGTVLIPMNLVCGLWGMNVHVPGQDIESGYAWFGGILGALLLFAVVGGWSTMRFFSGSH